MSEPTVTVEHADGSVRVIPRELLKRYTERGWQETESKPAKPAAKS